MTRKLSKLTKVGQLGYNVWMTHIRTITSSEVKGALGQLLGSLASEGPIEITRNGHLVGVLSAPPKRTLASDADRMSMLAMLYAAGKLTWREIADETGAAFGDLLLELSKQDLELPRVTPEKRPEQVALLGAIFRQASKR